MIIVNRHNFFFVLLNVELALLSLNIIFLVHSIQTNDIYPQIIAFFILTIAAAESAIGLAILIVFYKVTGGVHFGVAYTGLRS